MGLDLLFLMEESNKELLLILITVFIVNADHGLIVGTNKNNGSGIGLTVNGAVKVRRS